MTELPTVPGWYWWRHWLNPTRRTVVEIVDRDGTLYIDGLPGTLADNVGDSELFGPLTPP